MTATIRTAGKRELPQRVDAEDAYDRGRKVTVEVPRRQAGILEPQIEAKGVNADWRGSTKQ